MIVIHFKTSEIKFFTYHVGKRKSFKISSGGVNWYILYGGQFGNNCRRRMQFLFPSLPEQSHCKALKWGLSYRLRQGNKTSGWTLQDQTGSAGIGENKCMISDLHKWI